jgi:trk system potassium uptake protein TrkH
MVKLRVILLVLGVLLFVESAFLAMSVGVSAYYGENDFAALLISLGIIIVAASIFVFPNLKIDKKVEKREAYLIVASGWVVLSLFGALPFYISRYIPSYTDAFFETMSGFTTTGASILNDIEALPHGLLFWRSTTQWIGGMGIIVLSIAIIPLIKIGGMQLFNAEVPGISTDKLHPRIKETAKKLWLLYFGFTVLEAILLYAGGMSVFDAVNHSFTTMATGGYSTKQASIGHWDSSYIHYVIIVFMILAGTNFSLLYFAITGKFKKVFANTELKFYLSLILGSALLIGAGLWYFMDFPIAMAIKDSLFQVVSIMTTTGYITNDYFLWQPVSLWIILVLLMFVGGSSGSTGGGIKVVRIHILIRNSLVEFKRLIHPHAVLPVRYNKTVLHTVTINNVLAFVILYIILVGAGTVILAFTGLDFESSFGAVVTSIGNCGPGIGSVGPAFSFAHLTDFGKWLLSFMMLLGRLELFTVMIIFTRAFWMK